MVALYTRDMKIYFLLVCALTAPAAESGSLTVEELRVTEAVQSMAEVTDRFRSFFEPRLETLLAAQDVDQAAAVVADLGASLWLEATWVAQHDRDFDDRGLYWARLIIRKAVQRAEFAFPISAEYRRALLEILESTSRGSTQMRFTRMVDKRIVLSGFDPFLLDRNITQSNPSGVIALFLDGKVIEFKGVSAEINTFIAPVRYADFDDGEIEGVLSRIYERDNVDLITTVSMGRAHFDLERFPGRRRSATAPDNLNIYSGASPTNPKIPMLNGKQLAGPEFVEFSLPATVMSQAPGAYGININRQVTTLDQTFAAQSLADLEGAVAVRGGGGGYLSNEISYRSILLRNQTGSTIPTGHIHTPRIEEFDADVLKSITEQVIQMLRLSLTVI